MMKSVGFDALAVWLYFIYRDLFIAKIMKMLIKSDMLKVGLKQCNPDVMKEEYF